MISYIAVEEKLQKVVLNSKAVRGMCEGLDSDHSVVFVKIKIRGRWEYGGKNSKGNVSKMLVNERKC